MDLLVTILLILRIQAIMSDTSCETDLAHVEYSYLTSCTSAHVKEAVKSDKMCSPRPVIVQLPWPNNTNVQQMTPSNIELLQCDGGCHRNNRGCVSTQTRVKRVPVMMGKCGIGRGKCDKQCAEVIVEEHTACGCACTLSEEMCRSVTHSYNGDMCACECKDIIGKRECLDQGKVWDENICKCGCPVVFSCSKGTKYSNNTCSCEVIEIDKEINKIEDNRIPRSNNPSMITWEMVIIGILLGIILILFMIICMMILRLRRMKHIIKCKRSGDDPNDSEEYHEMGNKDIRDLKLGSATPHISSDPTYCDLDYYAASSGFGSEVSKNDLDDVKDVDHIYTSAESVRLKKRLQSSEGESDFAKATYSIDETLQLLTDFANKL